MSAPLSAVLVTAPTYAFFTGFALGFSLIVAIGAQNAFVLRQGLLRRHVFAVGLFCAVSDALLIAVGVGGLSLSIADFAEQHAGVLFGLASLWLAVYGAMRLRDAVRGDAHMKRQDKGELGLLATLGVAAALTFGNPHVYLDTVVLIGAVSLQFAAMNKLCYAFGAMTSSFVFFFGLVYGAQFLAPVMARPNAWRVLDAGIAVIMFALAAAMLRAGGLI